MIPEGIAQFINRLGYLRICHYAVSPNGFMKRFLANNLPFVVRQTNKNFNCTRTKPQALIQSGELARSNVQLKITQNNCCALNHTLDVNVIL